MVELAVLVGRVDDICRCRVEVELTMVLRAFDHHWHSAGIGEPGLFLCTHRFIVSLLVDKFCNLSLDFL